jgi:hypothetical protein
MEVPHRRKLFIKLEGHVSGCCTKGDNRGLTSISPRNKIELTVEFVYFCGMAMCSFIAEV